jgi:ankyrin repeat protein
MAPPPVPPKPAMRPVDLKLIMGAIDGDTKAILDSLRSGAQINVRDEEGDTALNLASYQGYIEAVKLLLELGSTMELHGKHGMTALLWASQQGHLTVVQTLLAKGSNINIRNNVRTRPFLRCRVCLLAHINSPTALPCPPLLLSCALHPLSSPFLPVNSPDVLLFSPASR